ncbi:zf-HC2 domain-containing protein [Mycobacterium sp. ML4]
MDCEVAREALSARLDGEREPVPSARVDQHLDECAACRDWYDQVGRQARELRRLVESRPVIAPVGPFGIQQTAPPPRPLRLSWQRWALLVVGVAQVGLAVAQGLGLDVGLSPAMDGTNHLLHESTSWSAALGAIMVLAALRPAASAGLAAVLTAFIAVLAVFVGLDAASGAVTTDRILTHLPVAIGAVLTTMVWRTTPAPGPAPQASEPDIVLPDNSSRGRRRGHLWPTDGSAA